MAGLEIRVRRDDVPERGAVILVECRTRSDLGWLLDFAEQGCGYNIVRVGHIAPHLSDRPLDGVVARWLGVLVPPVPPIPWS